MRFRLTFPAVQLSVCFAILVAIISGRQLRAADQVPVDFNRDIRPILSDHCFQCHGPDEKKRKGELRLDTEAGAFADHDGTHAVVAHDLNKSELFRRITTSDEAERMPPVKFARQLSSQQVELLKRWIEQGATWQKHWSLIPPVRAELPAVKQPTWCQNPIDYFVLQRLEREGLSPSAEADRATLIRRVTLDLTGLPPTPAEVTAFVQDPSTSAYEQVVDRLLKSPRYGERMAARWLDGARYADTSGYQSDGERYMWRWRDWVIKAYNDNLPFDQFTIQQIAGDLLPNATLDQRIATGFNRNHRGNSEGGIVPEEYAVEYVVDRVDTTSTVWLGLTMGCARCHDHKFDPLSQREYYEVFSLFNNVPEKGRAAKYGNSPPYILAPTEAQQARLKQLDQSLAAAKTAWENALPDVNRAQLAWETTLKPDPDIDSGLSEHLVARISFDHPEEPLASSASDFDQRKAKDSYHSRLRPGEAPLTDPKVFPKQMLGGPEEFADGKFGKALKGDGQRFYQAGNVAGFGFYDAFSVSCWIQPEGDQGGTIVSKMTDAADADGWYIALKNGKLQVNLVKRWLDDSLRVETAKPITSGFWQHVLVVYDGSRDARGVTVFLNGQPALMRIVLDELNQTFTSNEPLRIGGGGGSASRFKGLIDEVRIYDTAFGATEASILSTAATPAEIAIKPVEQRGPAEVLKLRRFFLDTSLPEPLAAIRKAVQKLEAERTDFSASFPTVMVMEELPTPKQSHILLRGEYDKPGQAVSPAVPVSMLSGERPEIRNRLDFAKWLVTTNNPLTARVAVNRMWQMYFGTGLVKTVDDLGSQGEWPSHPELLDWLATEFVRSGWNVKQLQKLIVMSAAYRQSSKVTPELLHRDPENRLLTRGPRNRLSAEMIRDQALAVSGLLVEQQGGPSVLPYQPVGLWKDLTGTDFTPEHGDSLYRRSMYTFWKRTVAPPGMVMFDASTREACMVKETRTNTPLQALNLMNDVTYVEAARELAHRVLKTAEISSEDRVSFAFRSVLARAPTDRETEILKRALAYHTQRFQKDPELAVAFLKNGEAPLNQDLKSEEFAALAAVCQMILNLDESVTKQ
jgi:mono/diheme cytochrome c family protein